MTPTDEQLRDLLYTYQHCRRWAHAGEVGANAVVLIAAIEELLNRRAGDRTMLHEFRKFFDSDQTQQILARYEHPSNQLLESRAAEGAEAATPNDIP